MGDTYSGSNCGKGDYRENKSLQKNIYNKLSPQSLSSRFSKWRRDGEGGKLGNCITKTASGIPSKSLIGIPERFALAMTDELGFVRRNTIIWHKPNCMPASVSDRFTVDFEYLYFFTKSPKYYFEQQFEPLKDVSIARLDRGVSESNKWINGDDGQTPHNLSQPRLNIKHRKMAGTKYGGDGKGLHDHSGYYSADGTPRFHPEGRNKRCVWPITTKGFPEAHFATFPEELIQTPIKAGCPEGGIMLDPFCGSSTTALVALKLNRQYIGFEISQKYVDMANRRLKPYIVQGKIFKATPTSVG